MSRRYLYGDPVTHQFGGYDHLWPSGDSDPTPPGPSNAYYVATTGDDDTGDGSTSTPWATITYGLSQISAGETLYVREGTYEERVTISSGGSSGSPIRIVGYPGDDRPVCRGFTISGDYVSVIGFEIWHANTSYIYGFVLTGDCSNVTILNNYIHHTNDQGIRANAEDCQNVTIRGNVLYMIGSPSTDGTDVNLVSGQNTSAMGIKMQWGDYHLIEYNEIQRAGDFCNCMGTHVIARNNYIHDFDESYFADLGGLHCDIFQMETGDWPTEPSEYHVYESNFCADNVEYDSHGYFMREYYNDQAGPHLVRGNVWHNFGSNAMAEEGADNVHMLHNTCDHCVQERLASGPYVRFWGNTFVPSGCSFKNNVAVSCGDTGGLIDNGASVSQGGNLRYDTGAGDITYASTSDPSFDDVANDDFHVGSSSAAINLGVAVTLVNDSAGSGTEFDVDDGTTLCDGYGIAEGDLIVVGSNAACRVLDVSGNTVTVDTSISWSDNDPVYWQGRRDAGALEYAASYTYSIAFTDPLDGENVNNTSKTITVSLSGADQVRQIELFIDNVPVDLQYDDLDAYSYAWDTSGYTLGSTSRLEVRAYPLYASETLWVSDTATVTIATEDS